jgi:hypothetical protein
MEDYQPGGLQNQLINDEAKDCPGNPEMGEQELVAQEAKQEADEVSCEVRLIELRDANEQSDWVGYDDDDVQKDHPP